MNKKIIIIGAGMAGIMAGKTLQDAGFDVVLLEARARVGGRTHTDHSLGNAVDLGASWIHGTEGNPLTPLAKSLNITLGYTDFLNRSITAVQAYADDGTPLNQADYAKGQIEANAAFYTSTGSLLFAPPKDGRSLKDWVQHGFPKPDNLSPAAEQGFYYYSLIRTEYTCASDWEKIDWELGRNYVGLPGGDHLVYGGGFNTITDHLAQALDIQLNTAVSGITTTEDGVRLQTTAGQMNSDFVVLTVPLGVLKSSAIHFDPPLPEEKTAVIQRIGFGNYEKLALRFDKFYWPKEAQRFNYLSDGEPSLYHAWLNLGHYTGDPVLVSYHAGRRAQRINQMSDGELIENVVTVMQRIFGDNGFGEIPAPQAYVRTNWQNDPYSQGSYSFDQVGQQRQDRQILAAPINGCLFFAGEATHPHYYATVHGAYESGIRAARQILAIAK